MFPSSGTFIARRMLRLYVTARVCLLRNDVNPELRHFDRREKPHEKDEDRPGEPPSIDGVSQSCLLRNEVAEKP